jgi:hypothetical protein
VTQTSAPQTGVRERNDNYLNLLVCRTRRQVPQNRHSYLLLVRRFNQQKDPTEEKSGLKEFESRMSKAFSRNTREKERRPGGIYYEPSHKQVHGLEGIEANAVIRSESMRGKEKDGRNYAEYRDVTEDACSAVADAVQSIMKFGGALALACSAVVAERGVGVDLGSAASAKGHGSQKLTLPLPCEGRMSAYVCSAPPPLLAGEVHSLPTLSAN